MSAAAIADEHEEPVLDPGAVAAVLDFPCSAAQEHFWVLEQLEPGNAALNIAVRWQIDGPVAHELLRQAFQGVIDRHEVLRTSFHDIDGAPVQRVLPSATFHLAEVDLTAVAPARRDGEAVAIAAREARLAFSLGDAPLLRATLLRLSQTRSVLLVTAHHLVCDGWSVGIIAREVGLRYAAAQQGTPPMLPPLVLQYADYALWQAEWVKAGGLREQVEYWTAQLAGMRRFEVRPDHPRPKAATNNGNIVSVLLPRTLTDALHGLARRHGATLFPVALAGLSALLHRFTAETTVTLGTQVAGRDDVELEHLVGLFINTVVLRIDVSGNPTFGEHVDRVRDTVRDALANQRTPTKQIVAIVRPDRDFGRDPLIAVNFIFQRSFIANATYGNIALTDLPSVTAGALYDLNFFMVERPEGWRLSCEYNTDLFDTRTIEDLLHAFDRLLTAAVADAERPVGDYVIIDAADRARLIEAAADTQLPPALVEQLPGVGRSGSRLYVVEQGGQLALPNAAGELWLSGVEPSNGGSAVAEAARFVADGFGLDPRRRLYRSGALVRRRPAGLLEAFALPSDTRRTATEPAVPDTKVEASRPAQSLVESRLAAIWAAALEVPTVEATENFFDLGGHSLLAARMLARVEASFGHRLPLRSLFEAPTIREFAGLLAPVTDGLREFEVVPVNARGDRTPVFAINNSALFHRLSGGLGPDQPFISVSAYDAAVPEEFAPQTFEAIAARFVDIIKRTRPRGPYILLGLCVAGNIAFEAAQQLAAQGEQVPLLVLIDAWAPGYADSLSRRAAFLADLSYRAQCFAVELRKLVRGRLSPLDYLGQRGFIKAARKRALRLAHQAGRLRSIPLEAHSAWFQGNLEAASRAYRPRPYAGPILLLHSPDEPSGRFLDPTLGWARVAGGGLSVQAIPGDHLGIFEEPGATIMAGHIDRALEAVRRGDRMPGSTVA